MISNNITEREMQDNFIKDIKKFKKLNETKEWFEEVGKHDVYFRCDIVSYENKSGILIEGYELKLKSCKELELQIQKHFYAKRFNKIYAVLPVEEAVKFKKRITSNYCDSIYVLGYDIENREIKLIKRGKEIQQSLNSKVQIMDLIIRGFHKEGKKKKTLQIGG